MDPRSPSLEREAREIVQMRLALVSAIVWSVVSFLGVMFLTWLADGRPRAPHILLVGSLALLVAALPWWRYQSAVRDRAARLRAVRGQPAAVNSPRD